MSETSLHDHAGYFGIVVPEKKFKQGFFLPQPNPSADVLLDALRAKFSVTYMDSSAVVVEIPGLAGHDQALAGSLLGFMVEMAAGGDNQRLAIGAGAFLKLTGLRYFWIKAIQSRAGTRTNFYTIPSCFHSIDLARRYIKNLSLHQTSGSRSKAFIKPL